ncbi:MAG: hypothetical protein V1777_04780 [Candidatus Micrarchaeota archaeon]
MKTCGQVSLEFLLIAAAFLGILLVMMAALTVAFESGQFALSVSAAQYLANEIQSDVDTLSVLGENSQISVDLPAFSNGRLVFQNNAFELRLISDTTSTEKVFSRELSLFATPAEFDLDASQRIILEKTGGNLTVNRQPD